MCSDLGDEHHLEIRTISVSNLYREPTTKFEGAFQLKVLGSSVQMVEIESQYLSFSYSSI